MAMKKTFVNLSQVLTRRSSSTLLHPRTLQPHPHHHPATVTPLVFARLYSVSSQDATSPSSSGTNLRPAFFKPRLVIFDKDGTLVCFHTMWNPWCESLADRMVAAAGIDVTHQLYDVLGFDYQEKKVRIGALAENTHPQIRQQIVEMLQTKRGMSGNEAQGVVAKAWRDTPDEMQIKLTGDCYKLFSRLKTEGVKIAICTSDSREGTTEFLERQNLSDLVDMVVCGDDATSKPKPNPHNALYICKKMGVNPSETIMVGDTPADTLMGQQANLGLTVGVLTGVGNKEDLADADVIVSDVQECVEMILPPAEGTNPCTRSRVHQVTTRGLFKIAQGAMKYHTGTNVNNNRGFATDASTMTNNEFSHVIVGAGSAGCVLANRLSEDREAEQQ